VTPAGTAVFAYAIASRLAYILFVGIALRRQEREAAYTRRWGVEGGFQRFRRVASVVMVNDVFAFALLCVVTHDTLMVGASRALELVVGGVLVIVGIAVKVWATATLGGRPYYWYNFFAPAGPHAVVKLAGPYRILKNPMYTVGYLQAYGFALITASLPGLVWALFAQAAILAFYYAVERPHFQRLNGK
jgi:protein-S-isoprenylcysteine O-methyltransferase Ste14